MKTLTAEQALGKLRAGNENYCSQRQTGDYSLAVRRRLFREGQSPYAVIVACSDSRVVPEAIFDAGLGDLFVVRVAGNVAGMHEIASIDYAVSHLGTPLVAVLGHTGCGAVAAALSGGGHGPVAALTDEILRAVSPSDPSDVACRKNALASASAIRSALEKEGKSVRVVAAVCDIKDGRVEFL